MSNFGKIVRLRRIASGQSQRQLAATVGCSPNYLSLIEGDKKQPSMDMSRRIAEALGASLPVLLALITDESDVPEGKARALIAEMKDLLLRVDEYLRTEGGSVGTEQCEPYESDR